MIPWKLLPKSFCMSLHLRWYNPFLEDSYIFNGLREQKIAVQNSKNVFYKPRGKEAV